MTYQRRPVPPGVVSPLACVVLSKPEIAQVLEPYLRKMEASPAEVNQRAAADVRVAFTLMREVARLWVERERGCSDVGTSEQVGGASVAESVSSSSAGMTSQEVAVRLGISEQLVTRYCRSRRLTATRAGPGHPWLIDEASVAELEATRRSA